MIDTAESRSLWMPLGDEQVLGACGYPLHVGGYLDNRPEEGLSRIWKFRFSVRVPCNVSLQDSSVRS